LKESSTAITFTYRISSEFPRLAYRIVTGLFFNSTKFSLFKNTIEHVSIFRVTVLTLSLASRTCSLSLLILSCSLSIWWMIWSICSLWVLCMSLNACSCNLLLTCYVPLGLFAAALRSHSLISALYRERESESLLIVTQLDNKDTHEK